MNHIHFKLGGERDVIRLRNPSENKRAFRRMLTSADLALLETCDVNNHGRHLGFYQDLEIRLKPREMVIFLALHEK